MKNLKSEDFELRVDGKSQPIGFFDQIEAGSVDETRQLAAARGQSAPTGKNALPTMSTILRDLLTPPNSCLKVFTLVNIFCASSLLIASPGRAHYNKRTSL